jgi:hypothetical protein
MYCGIANELLILSLQLNLIQLQNIRPLNHVLFKKTKKR